MFCIKCGTKLPEGSNFCSKCGANLSSTNENTPPNKEGKCLFLIEMKKAFGGMAAKTKVYIDGNLVKELASGESFSLVLNNGKHNLYCDALGMDRTQSFEFIGDNNEISYYVQYPSMTQSMTNFGGRSLIVNKTKETNPGTYDVSLNESKIDKTLSGFYITKQNTRLYEYDTKINVITDLSAGETVEYIETGNLATIESKTHNMWKIRIEDGRVGFCFSAYLEKINK